MRQATAKMGLFQRGALDVSGSTIGSEAANHINALRLQRSLTIDQAKLIFTDTGSLTPEAIKNSLLIKPGEELGNSLLRNELARIGGDISDWGKFLTESIASPSGNFQMHFYRNSVTGNIYYGMDYKAVFDHQGAWNFAPSPNFSYEQPRFNY